MEPTTTPHPTSSAQVIDELRAEIAELRQRLDGAPAAHTRRHLLRLGGAAAIGAVAAAAASSGNAAAASAITLDTLSNRATLPTAVTMTASNRLFGFASLDNDRLDLTTAQIPTASLLGHAAGAGFNTGVAGVGTDDATVGVYGTAALVGVYGLATKGYGVMASGVGGAILVASTRTPPPSRPNQYHGAGVIDTDIDGTLWYCVGAGSPPQWRRLAGRDTDGAFTSIDPVRVYDSRLPTPNQGVLGSGASRVVSVAGARDATTGAIVTADVVPDGVWSIACNLTITETTGAGYLALAPGNSTSSPASSINWSTTGQTLANGLIVKVHTDRTVKLFSGGGGSAHVVIDVNGYWR